VVILFVYISFSVIFHSSKNHKLVISFCNCGVTSAFGLYVIDLQYGIFKSFWDMTLCSLVNSYQLSEELVQCTSRIVCLPRRNFSRPNYLPMDRASCPKRLEFSISGYAKHTVEPCYNDICLYNTSSITSDTLW
jgi:hypothetical protein